MTNGPQSQIHNTETAKICFLYYEQGLKQEEIAKVTNKSTITISRTLKQARENGFVETRIKFPYPNIPHLEYELATVFPNINSFLVLDNDYFIKSDIKTSLGKAAASYLPFFLKNGDHIGVGAGKTLAQLALFLPKGIELQEIEVVQLGGMLDPEITPGNPAVTTQVVCSQLRAKGYFYALPGSVFQRIDTTQSPLITNAQERLQVKWKEVDVGIVGIGEAGKSLTSLERGKISEEDLERLRERGAVGDILLHFFDKTGRIVDEEFDRNVTGISWKGLSSIPQLIAVAGGRTKIEAINGALHSGVINLLIIDRDTAQEVLKG